MDSQRAKVRQRRRRAFRVRKRLRGTAEQPRLCVSRSHRNITAQLIDDASGKTVASASTLEKSVAEQVKYGGNKSAAAAVGKVIAERGVAAGVKAVSFDRGAYKYHGRVAELANAAREGGLEF